jgi:hypothetical protein
MKTMHLLLVPVLSLTLASCGSSPEETKAAPTASRSPNSSSAPVSASPSPTRTPTTKIKDCFDGDCLLEVDGPVDIKLDKKTFYYPEFSIVSVDENSLTYYVEYPHGGGAQQVLSPGGGGSFAFRDNTPVEVKLVSVKDGKALLSLTPGRRG